MRKYLIVFFFLLLPSLAFSQTIIKSFPIKEYASGLAFDGEHFWYGIYGPNSGWIFKVDTTDGSILDSIPNPGNDVYGLTWDGTHLWVMCAYPQDSIYKIDTLGSVVHAFTALADYHAGLAWDGTNLWNGRYYPNPGFIFKLNPLDGSPLDTIPPPDEQTWDLAWDGEYLWVADYYADSVYKVDPLNGSVLFSFETPATTPKGLAWFGNYLALIDKGTTYQEDMLYIIDVAGGGNPEIYLGANSHDYGHTIVGDTSIWNLYVSNVGDAPLILFSISSDKPEFEVFYAFPDTLVPLDYRNIPVGFMPSSFDSFYATLIVISNDPINPSLYVSLSGIGISEFAEIELSSYSHDFGSVRVGASVRWALEVMNLGAQPLTIDSVRVSDPSFYVTTGFPMTIDSVSSDLIYVWFSPDAGGSYSATLTLFTNDSDESEVNVYLSGYGEDSPVPPGSILWSYRISYEYLDPYVRVIRTISDINGDGVSDVVVGTENDTLYCFHGNASGTGIILWYLPGPSIYSDRGLINFDDINGDGYDDIIIGTKGGYVDPYDRSVVAVSSLDGAVLWTFDTRQWGNGGWVYEVAPFVDITGDGIREILAGVGGDAERALIINGATGELICEKHFIDAAVLGIQAIGDINDDGIPEIACGVADSDPNVRRFYLLDGSNCSNVIWDYQTGEANWSVTTIGDITGDDIPDVIGGGSSGWVNGQVLAFNGLNGSLIWSHSEGGIIQHVRVIRDVNGSGYDDLIFSGVPPNFVCIEGSTGYPIWTVASGHQVQAINPVPDHDGDGIEEVAGGTGYSVNKVVFLRGTDGYIFWQFSTVSAVKSVYWLEDISGDGGSEILAGTKDGWIYCLSGGWYGAPEETFIRGDVNADMSVNTADLSFLANYFYFGGPTPSCMDAADVNDDGSLNTADLSYLAYFLYLGGSNPPSPYPDCGVDPTEDSLDCGSHPCQGSYILPEKPQKKIKRMER